jgi:hypothetical protein
MFSPSSVEFNWQLTTGNRRLRTNTNQQTKARFVFVPSGQ